ncbi:dTDP-4-dehydrorhamnose reductase [Paenibacillus rigui]|uniref:dTDP-4-dehydrorhamnose reductase n=1 Tax=Paenibacillus rigui TaxID=554312 RepID=A0A229UJA5_9BACL|nr:dTDP-4-dehydrorhamnose reductase [Paenibacillus rigui]OXM83476.1 dTDP-4-dehydrorhamnose reductase [Paenibacillus rigui]
MNIVITGAGGQLGHDLIRVLGSSGEHRVSAMSRQELDVTDENAVFKAIAAIRPEVIIHAAAYTQVDLAESHMEEAYMVNSFGTRNVALAAAQTGAKLVYISTDYVFDGTKRIPYTESDRTNPISIYGNSKLHGEKFVQITCERYYIVRTSWLYGKHGTNFVTKVLSWAEQKEELKMIHDQFGSPTYTYDLARFIHQLIATEHYGIYHAANRGACSRLEFAREILRLAGKSHIKLQPVSSDQFPTPARRPEYSVFDAKAIRENGLEPLPPWQEALRMFLEEDLPGNQQGEGSGNGQN